MDKELQIGDIIQYLRKKHHLSQEKLAENICSREYLISIEKNRNSPTCYILDLLSKKLNCDIYHLYNEINRHHDLKTHNLIKDINDEISSGNITCLNDYYHTCKQLKSFNSGEPLQFLFYIKALYASNHDENYTIAISFAKKGLAVLHHDLVLTDKANNIFTNLDLVLIHLIGVNYCRLEQYENGFLYLNYLLNYLRPFTSTSKYTVHERLHFEVKLFCAVIYNITTFNIHLHKLNGMLQLIDEGVDVLLKFKYSVFLVELLQNKCIIYAELNQNEKSINLYNDIIILNKYLSHNSNLSHFTNKFEHEYSYIFD